MSELIAAAAGLGLGAWFLLYSDASDQARTGIALLMVVSVVLRLGFDYRVASTLLFAVIAIGVLLFRRYRGER
ncbi:hypothetical protein [Lysobacter solisilvae (ex Woo and Kim 2020)]|uniref:Uncharacterized protein n=1 Tax=Agrilutibacter terrestris TaxID=2865112 RepID=A0A7H0FZJ8_9GAMM|nr:hypothetical protein [Lysobacter terrestris]QNP41464.1 hypothetical protein H8B22_04375 [Lysobacter terrestris]